MFLRALTIYPSCYVSTLCSFGILLLKHKVNAAVIFSRALAVDPNHDSTTCSMGDLLLHHKRDINGAKEMYERALAIDENSLYALASYSDLLLDTDDSDKAFELYNRITIINEKKRL